MAPPADLKEQLDRIEAKVEALHTRLYVGNGQPAVMTRLDRVERIIRQIVVVITAVVISVVGASVKYVFDRYSA